MFLFLALVVWRHDSALIATGVHTYRPQLNVFLALVLISLAGNSLVAIIVPTCADLSAIYCGENEIVSWEKKSWGCWPVGVSLASTGPVLLGTRVMHHVPFDLQEPVHHITSTSAGPSSTSACHSTLSLPFSIYWKYRLQLGNSWVYFFFIIDIGKTPNV